MLKMWCAQIYARTGEKSRLHFPPNELLIILGQKVASHLGI